MSTKRTQNDQSPSSKIPLKRQNTRGESDEFEKKCVDTVRVLSADIVEKANSGHPGAPMGCAPIAHVLFSEFMHFSPSNPSWSNRDRFILSNGHACALLYSMLHLTGYNVSIDDLKRFRQLGSITPGHPENFVTPGVEVSTGPLGQGISNAVGFAIAEKNLAATFNKDDFNIVDHFTYVICGDGCLQEGVSAEASSLAGHLGLGKLIVCYDDNHITIDGSTDLSFTEDVNMRYNSYNWHVQTVDDVNDLSQLRKAIDEAKAEVDRPSIIKIRTVIGFGSSKQGCHDVHGAPLGKVDLANTKKLFGFDSEQSFHVSEDVKGYYNEAVRSGQEIEASWNTLFGSYAEKFPDLAAEYTRRMEGRLPDNFDASSLPHYSSEDTKQVATRQRSEESLNAVASALPELIGGSADLTPSTLTKLKCSGDFQKNTPLGRYIRFGVREHAMAAICNGLFAHGGFRPFCATFLNFIGYALGSVRLSALSRFGVLYIMTHDSIGLGEDGPTHQPVEMLETLRTIPNLLTLRPCDGNETAGAYLVALQHRHTPSVLSLSRQGGPNLAGSAVDKVALGAYVIAEFKNEGAPLDFMLVATGMEISLAVDVAKQLHSVQGLSVRVVSMPCTELFDQQSHEYQQSLFPDGVPCMSVEASGQRGWRNYAHATFGLTGYGVSAPGKDAFSHFGFTVANLSQRALDVLEFYRLAGQVPSLVNYPKIKNQGAH